MSDLSGSESDGEYAPGDRVSGVSIKLNNIYQSHILCFLFGSSRFDCFNWYNIDRSMYISLLGPDRMRPAMWVVRGGVT